MEVAPGGNVAPHSDYSLDSVPNNFDPLDILLPINIAITHPKECFMTLKNKGVVPWENVKTIFVNISNYHSVINFSNVPRIHLIMHGIPGNRKTEFCELIVKSYVRNYL
jgi:hypothetical protein